MLTKEFRDYKGQLIRCSSSVGANYRAACRAKSTRDFINKLKIVEEELDESLFLLKLFQNYPKKRKLGGLQFIRKEMSYLPYL